MLRDATSRPSTTLPRAARVVIVGDVGLNMARADIYAKELDVLISCSYGPGRYDPVYEEEGADYPLAYVRWTENRNMGEYLRLLAAGRVRLDNMIQEPFPIDQAEEAYGRLSGEGQKPLLVLLKYPPREGAAHPVLQVHAPGPIDGRIKHSSQSQCSRLPAQNISLRCSTQHRKPSSLF